MTGPDRPSRPAADRPPYAPELRMEVTQSAAYPGVEDATMTIHRMTDEALPDPSGNDFAATWTDRPAGASAGSQGATAVVTDELAGTKTANTSGVVRAGAMMGIATIVSRVTGMLSKVVLAGILGASLVNSSYTVANTLPNIVFELLIGGVLTSVAIPLLTRAQRSDADGGLEYTQRLLSLAITGLAVATGLAMLAAPVLTRFYGVSASNPNSDPHLANLFALLLLPQIFFYGIAALFGAILNTKERFAANAWAPVLNNVVVIAVAATMTKVQFSGYRDDNHMGTGDVLFLGIGTTLGIIVQALVMLPSLHRAGFRWKWRWGWDRRFKESSGLLGWATIYVLISQVGVAVTTSVAQHNSSGGATLWQYGSLIFQMPYGIVGVALLTAIMPRMARHAAAGQMDAVKNDMSLANRLSAVALLPICAALVVLGSAVTTVLYRHGHLTLESALAIGGIVSGLALGLVPLSMTLVQMRVFYAMKDGRTPTLINLIMVAVRLPLMLACPHLLPPQLVIAGVGVATAFSYLVGAVVGELWLRSRFGPMGSRRTLTTIGKMTVASAAGGAAAYFAVKKTFGITPDGVIDALKMVALGGVTGLVVIAILATLLQVEELTPIRNRVLRMAGIGAKTPAAPLPKQPPVPVGQVPAGAANLVVSGTAGPATRPAVGGSAYATPGNAQGGLRHVARQPAPEPGTAANRTPPSREQVTQRVTSTTGGPEHTPGPDQATGRGSVEVGQSADSTTTIRRLGAADVGSDATITMGSPAEPAHPPVTLSPGATVGGRYRLVSLVASDSAGNRFWRAKDTVLPRDMAVTMLPDTNATSATVARTLRAGRLHHIGLPQTLDVGTEHGQSYVVGQWVDGATLTDLLAGGPLEPDVATSITSKVSEAVAEAHRNGIALGAINPSLVRVNFDGQVRLSHVIAHGSATPDQDIRAVGALLYLMLTGMWPLPTESRVGSTGIAASSAAQPTGHAALLDPTVNLGAEDDSPLPPAPTRLGREVPADEVRAGVPEALSALAERALHPDEPAGIHAVGAIAALLRRPEAVTNGTPAVTEPAPTPGLSPAERRLVKERRIKLSVAAIMLAAFSTLIIIVVASLAKQLLSAIEGPPTVSGQTPAASAGPVPGTTPATASSPGAAKNSAKPGTSSAVKASTSTAPVATGTPVTITNATVYDPKGHGQKDNTSKVGRAFDGDTTTFWSTYVYKQQFPTTKPGVGLTLELANSTTPTSVQVTSNTPGTTVEILTASEPNAPYTDTKVVGTGTITAGPVTIPVTGATPSKYLIVFVTQLAPDGNRFKSDINEITVNGH